MSTSLRILEADLANPLHAEAVCSLKAAYALDAMGNGGPLPEDVLERLVPALRVHPTTVILLAYDGDQPVGIATSFAGFSTFAARPLLNIHDFAVLPGARGRGVGAALLAAAETLARSRGCSNVTLEVQEGNHRARRVYEAAGFPHALRPARGRRPLLCQGPVRVIGWIPEVHPGFGRLRRGDAASPRRGGRDGARPSWAPGRRMEADL